MNLTRRFAVLACSAVLEIPAATIVWVKVSEPMERTYWSQIAGPELLDDDCASDRALPRVCLYRRKGWCRIIIVTNPSEIAPRTIEELRRMCDGYFPAYPQLNDVPLRRKLSDPDYLPNQAPPSVDPAWQFQARNPQP